MGINECVGKTKAGGLVGQIDDLKVDIELLGKRIAEFGSKLEPILSAPDCKTAPGQDCPSPPKCGVRISIEGINETIKLYTSLLEDLITRSWI